MTEKHIKTSLKIIGLVVFLRGLHNLIPYLKLYYWEFISSNFFRDWFDVPAIALINIYATMLLSCVVIAGYALLILKPWSRIFAIGALGADFMTLLFGAINTWTFYWRHPEMKQLHAEMTEQAAKGSGDYHVMTASIIPAYIEGVLALVIIIFLMNAAVKNFYNSLSPDTTSGDKP